MDKLIDEIIEEVLLIERNYAYEKRGVKSQRQAHVEKRVEELLNKISEDEDVA